MPDFTVRHTAGIDTSVWLDPPVPIGFLRPTGTIPAPPGWAALHPGQNYDPGDPPAAWPGMAGFPNREHDYMLHSRLNPHPGHPHRKVRARPGVPFTFKATVDGVEGPMDAALGGRLFYCWPIGFPTGAAVPAFTAPAGQSSVRTVLLTTPGNYHFGMGRHGGGGAVLMHIDCVTFADEPT